MALQSNSIFFIDVDKIDPNPYQPRKDFEDAALRDLADSIRQYGVLQPVTVSRTEIELPDGMGMETRYELIAGERRLRASKLAGSKQIPVIIRDGDDEKAKLELAIIENLQREDLNAVDRARAFVRLIDEFKLTHAEVGRKMGKSREYVSNSLRILQMSQEILEALQAGQIMEGHTRPLMMLSSRPQEQNTLFKEIVYKKLSVSEAERIARRIAVDRVRKRELLPDANVMSIEDELEEHLGTRVHIQRKADGGKITIDFFSDADLDEILQLLKSKEKENAETMLQRFERVRAQVSAPENLVISTPEITSEITPDEIIDAIVEEAMSEAMVEDLNDSINDNVEESVVSIGEILANEEPVFIPEFTPEFVPKSLNQYENPGVVVLPEIIDESVMNEPIPVAKQEEQNTDELYNISNFSI